MTDDFIYWNVSVLLNKNGTRNKTPKMHPNCCLSLDQKSGHFIITRGVALVYNLHAVKAFPKPCGILITGLEKFRIKYKEAFRYQELWCFMPSDSEVG